MISHWHDQMMASPNTALHVIWLILVHVHTVANEHDGSISVAEFILAFITVLVVLVLGKMYFPLVVVVIVVIGNISTLWSCSTNVKSCTLLSFLLSDSFFFFFSLSPSFLWMCFEMFDTSLIIQKQISKQLARLY